MNLLKEVRGCQRLLLCDAEMVFFLLIRVFGYGMVRDTFLVLNPRFGRGDFDVCSGLFLS